MTFASFSSMPMHVAIGLLALTAGSQIASGLVAPSYSSSSLKCRLTLALHESCRRSRLPLFVSNTADEITDQLEEIPVDAQLSETGIRAKQAKAGFPVMEGLVVSLAEKIGTVDDDRLVFPELQTGEVPRLYSTLSYMRAEDGTVEKAVHAEGSVLGSAALVAGTTIGAGVLAIPTATAAAGFLPSSAALGIAWVYMTMSGLLIAELTLNRIVTSGRPGLGLLDLYEHSLGKKAGMIGSVAYFFLHYAVMVAYVAQGGASVAGFFEAIGLNDVASIPGFGQILFAGTCGAVLYTVNAATVEKMNSILVLGVVATLLGIVTCGFASADWGALLNPELQHPEEVVNCFPILFLALVYQNVVPTVVNRLEGNRSKITNAVIAGTTVPFLMFLLFNGIILGNAISNGVDLTSGVNPVTVLQSNGDGGVVGNLVGGFSVLALITSLIGFTYGLLDAWTGKVLKVRSAEMPRSCPPLIAFC
jgi:tyrosine-specific transport protein